MEREGLLSILNLAEESNLIDLVQLMGNRITNECLSVFNFDGSMRKNQKSKALQSCTMTPHSSNPKDYIALIDMGFIWRLATPTPDDREFVWDGSDSPELDSSSDAFVFDDELIVEVH